VFTGLISYDTQKLKALDVEDTEEGSEQEAREAIDGALELYLDFVNLFLQLLRIFGRKR
jgi:FtsH-binding integral membrane protein